MNKSKNRPKWFQNNFQKKQKGVVRGNKIKVQNLTTKEKIEMKVSDSQNPFIGKEKFDIVKIKGVEYQIIGVYYDSNKKATTPVKENRKK